MSQKAYAPKRSDAHETRNQFFLRGLRRNRTIFLERWMVVRPQLLRHGLNIAGWVMGQIGNGPRPDAGVGSEFIPRRRRVILPPRILRSLHRPSCFRVSLNAARWGIAATFRKNALSNASQSTGRAFVPFNRSTITSDRFAPVCATCAEISSSSSKGILMDRGAVVRGGPGISRHLDLYCGWRTCVTG